MGAVDTYTNTVHKIIMAACNWSCDPCQSAISLPGTVLLDCPLLPSYLTRAWRPCTHNGDIYQCGVLWVHTVVHNGNVEKKERKGSAKINYFPTIVVLPFLVAHTQPRCMFAAWDKKKKNVAGLWLVVSRESSKMPKGTGFPAWCSQTTFLLLDRLPQWEYLHLRDLTQRG